MATLDSLSNNNGIFTIGDTGKVAIDYLFDGGAFRGEVAIFSIEGMENLEINSAAFTLEATRRALSNSAEGFVLVRDSRDRARFSGSFAWERNFNSGEYRGLQSYWLAPGERYALMLIPNSTVSNLANFPNTTSTQIRPLYSFGNINNNGSVTPQITDITGAGDTFGWEDSNPNFSDRDYNDLIIQVQGATATAAPLNGNINPFLDWRNTSTGEEILAYANRPRFERGAFEVNPTGMIQTEYLFDGGWYQGELGVFSLTGMETLAPGSTEFIQEAARRALSNSQEGRVLIRDRSEGARFNGTLGWETNYNNGEFLGLRSFTLKPGDTVAFMLTQNNTVRNLYLDPAGAAQTGKIPLFSIPEANLGGGAQMVALDQFGAIGVEDNLLNNGADRDYNDFVFQVRGVQGNLSLANTLVNTNRDLRTTTVGQSLLAESAKPAFSTGVFTVGQTGLLQFDYLYDGGGYQSEMAVFSLTGMENLQAGSLAFAQEAARRAVSNSNLGRIFIRDRTEGAKFQDVVSWENNFNRGAYLGTKVFAMTPGDRLGFMLVQNTTAQELANNITVSSQSGKLPIFSIPEANLGGAPVNQMVRIDDNGTYAFEDLRVDLGQSDQDYNDVLFQVKGANGAVLSVDQAFNSDRDWRQTQVGQELLTYSNRAFFDQGVLVTDSTGLMTVDFLYDGGEDFYQGGGYYAEVGIFSLKGLETLQIGSAEFTQAALTRALSNSAQGTVIVQDSLEGAKYSANLDWEGTFNDGVYQGVKTLQLNANETYGLVMVSGTTLADELLNPSGKILQSPLFSMNTANLDKTDQFGLLKAQGNGAVVSFEDVQLNNGSNRDYNDIVLGFRGVTFLEVPQLNELVPDNRQWYNLPVGETLLTEFFA
ncbi:MAG: DUF4114 domain-containing protein [Cyanobacteriota bacterium]|jgi:hypothetical protein